jgi:hypothetical protein
MIKINDFNTQHISCEYADSVIKMEDISKWEIGICLIF